MPRRSQAQSAETGRRIIRCAETRFAADGYAAASLDAIAVDSGVTRGAVYHHFGSKAGLFAAVVEGLQSAVGDAVAARAEQVDGPSAQLRAGCHRFLDVVTAGPASRILLVDAPAVLGWAEWRRLDAHHSGRHLAEAIAAIGAHPADALTQLLSGGMNEIALWIVESGDDADAIERAHAALDLVLDSVCGAAPPRTE